MAPWSERRKAVALAQAGRSEAMELFMRLIFLAPPGFAATDGGLGIEMKKKRCGLWRLALIANFMNNTYDDLLFTF